MRKCVRIGHCGLKQGNAHLRCACPHIAKAGGLSRLKDRIRKSEEDAERIGYATVNKHKQEEKHEHERKD